MSLALLYSEYLFYFKVKPAFSAIKWALETEYLGLDLPPSVLGQRRGSRVEWNEENYITALSVAHRQQFWKITKNFTSFTRKVSSYDLLRNKHFVFKRTKHVRSKHVTQSVIHIDGKHFIYIIWRYAKRFVKICCNCGANLRPGQTCATFQRNIAVIVASNLVFIPPYQFLDF